MADAEQIREYVHHQLAQRMSLLDLEPSSITDELNLVGSGVLDSMGFVELVGRVEKRFQIEVDFGDLDPAEFTSLKGFLKCVIGSK